MCYARNAITQYFVFLELGAPSHHSASLLLSRSATFANMLDPEVIRADPALRRRTLLMVLAATVIGAVGIAVFLPWLLRSLNEARMAGRIRARTICTAFLVVIAAVGASVVWLSTRYAAIARRVRTERQFPPADMKVIRDTRVLRGTVAVRLGRVQQGLAFLLGLCGASLIALAVYAGLLLYRVL
jgi:hypothetical protein